MFELLFGKTATTTTTAIAEPVDERAMRKRFLLDEITRLDSELLDADGAMRAFKLRHTCLVDGRTAILNPSGSDTGKTRASVEAEYKTLVETWKAIKRAGRKRFKSWRGCKGENNGSTIEL